MDGWAGSLPAAHVWSLLHSVVRWSCCNAAGPSHGNSHRLWCPRHRLTPHEAGSSTGNKVREHCWEWSELPNSVCYFRTGQACVFKRSCYNTGQYVHSNDVIFPCFSITHLQHSRRGTSQSLGQDAAWFWNVVSSHETAAYHLRCSGFPSLAHCPQTRYMPIWEWNGEDSEEKLVKEIWVWIQQTFVITSTFHLK